MKTIPRQHAKPISAEFIRAALESDNRPTPNHSADIQCDPYYHVGAGIMRDLADHLLARGIRL